MRLNMFRGVIALLRPVQDVHRWPDLLLLLLLLNIAMMMAVTGIWRCRRRWIHASQFGGSSQVLQQLLRRFVEARKNVMRNETAGRNRIRRPVK